MQLVKLGGSVITVKGRLRTFRRRNTLRIARELASAGDDLVLVHGAGSFGHIKAKRHNIADGYKDRKQIPAVSSIQFDVRDLDQRIMECLIEAGMAPSSMPPGATCLADGGSVDSLDLGPYERYLGMGCTPVTFGDVVQDSRTRFSICSGDRLMYLLARGLRPERAVFVADVDGIFTGDPKLDPGARLIERLDRNTIKEMGGGRGSVADVTGSMGAKARMMLDIAALGVECWVVNGNVPGRVAKVLAGRDPPGTVAGGE